MYSKANKSSTFPDPLAPTEEKLSSDYALKYAKSIYDQWGKIDQDGSSYKNKKATFLGGFSLAPPLGLEPRAL